MFQEIELVGNLGRDVEMRYTQSGQAVANMNVATNRQYTRGEGGEKVTETVWFRCTAWGRQAEVAHQYLSKGSKVLIKGRMVADPETGGPKVFQKSDGSYGAAFEVTIRELKFLSGGNGASAEAEAEGTETEIPF